MAASNRTRLDRQRERQRAYRERVKAERKPTRDDIARALLFWVVTENLKRGRQDRLDDLQDHTVDRLVAQGFDRRAADAAFDDLVEKYRDGWTPQRKVHLKRGGRGGGGSEGEGEGTEVGGVGEPRGGSS